LPRQQTPNNVPLTSQQVSAENSLPRQQNAAVAQNLSFAQNLTPLQDFTSKSEQTPAQNPAPAQKLSPKLALRLAAPHTWLPASILPAMFAGIVSLESSQILTLWMFAILFFILLSIGVLMQSAVNIINDYNDYIKGTDTLSNSPEAWDAVLIYNNLSPKSVLKLGIGFLVVAGILGIIVTCLSSWIVLVIGLVGALAVLVYSLGKRPISYTPLGEFVSGFVMGGLIPLAICTALTGQFSWLVLLYSVPFMIGIGLVMMTNNTCDIERDLQVGRYTWPARLGRKKASLAYHILALVWIVAIVLLVFLMFPDGLIVLPVIAILGLIWIRPLFTGALTASRRPAAMGYIIKSNLLLNTGYTCAVAVAIAGGLL
jgi:1,4-dihydroxy-2-naphthoate octaprenyltransferase